MKDRILSILLAIVMLPLLVAGLHVGGKRRETPKHSTLILVDNFKHLGKCLIFLVLSIVLLVIVL